MKPLETKKICSGTVHKVRHAILANVDPLPLSHFVTHPGTPQTTSHISEPPPFLVGLVQKNGQTPPVQIFSQFFAGAFVRRSFVWKVLSMVVFVRIPPPVRIHLLQQRVKNHFKFHVSYV